LKKALGRREISHRGKKNRDERKTPKTKGKSPKRKNGEKGQRRKTGPLRKKSTPGLQPVPAPLRVHSKRSMKGKKQKKREPVFRKNCNRTLTRGYGRNQSEKLERSLKGHQREVLMAKKPMPKARKQN